MIRQSHSPSRARRASLCCLLAAVAAGAAAPAAPPVLEWDRQEHLTRTPPTPRSRVRRSLGVVPVEPGAFQRSWRVRVAPARRGERPDRVLLTRLLPPVADQGSQAACVAFMTGYYAYTYMVAKQQRLDPARVQDPRFQFSPAFIYNQANGGQDRGMTIQQAVQILQEKGCATLDEMPYRDGDVASQPAPETRERAERYRARAVGYLFEGKARRESGAADPEALKTFLAETRQPFVLALPLYADFPLGKVTPDFVYNLSIEPKKENFLGIHSAAVVGYDDSKRAFRVVNSWGTGWGDAGYLWIGEDYIRDHAMDGFVIVPGGAVARDATGGTQPWTRRITLVGPESNAPEPREQ